MPNYLPLPDGRYFELPEGVENPQEAVALAMERFPDLYRLSPVEAPPEPETGLVAGFRSGVEGVKGGVGAIGAALGVEGGAEFAEAQRKKQAEIYKQPEFTEAPVDYVTGLVGQSAAYMAAPALAALGVSLLPVTGTAAALLATGAATAVSATQFTGENLQRQLEEGTAPENLRLGAAVGAAIPQAALDTVSMKMLPGVGRLLGKWGFEATEEQALNAARKLAQASAAGVVKAGGVKVAQTAGVEGITEAAQQVLERWQADLDLMNPDARQEYLDNFVGGAVLGGLFGAGSRVGAQSRAKETVAKEERRVADEQATAEQARLDQLALLEGGTETRALPYVGGEVQATLPGIEEVAAPPQAEPAKEEQLTVERERRGYGVEGQQQFYEDLFEQADRRAAGLPETAPIEGTQLLQAQQKLQRVLEDNQQQMSDAIEQQDIDAYKKLRDQRGVLLGQLQTVTAALKASGFEDTGNKQLQLQQQIAKAQDSLSKMAGPGFDPAKADKLVNRIDELQAQLDEVGGAQQDMFGAKPQLMNLEQRNEQAQKEAFTQEMAARQAALQAAPSTVENQMRLFEESQQDLEQANRRRGQTDVWYQEGPFEKAGVPVPRDPNAPIFEDESTPEIDTLVGQLTQQKQLGIRAPETVTPLPRQEFESRKQAFDSLLSTIQKYSNSLDPKLREEAAQARDKIGMLRAGDDAYLKTVADARAQQDIALNSFVEALTGIRQGTYFGVGTNDAAQNRLKKIQRRIEKLEKTKTPVPSPLQRAFNVAKQEVERDYRLAEASTNLTGLRKQADNARANYIQAALQEAATHRRAQGLKEISVDEAVKAADEMRSALDAAVEEISVRSRAKRGNAYKEERVVLPAQIRGTQIIKSAVTEKRDVRPLAERPFGAPRAAQEVIVESLNVLPKIRDSLFGARQFAKTDTSFLKRQWAETEAKKVAEERGETAPTLKQELTRRTEFVRNKMAKMGAMRPMAAKVLNEAADIMDAGAATRTLLDKVESVVDAITNNQAIRQVDLRAIKDAISATEPTAVEQQAAGQKELFTTTTDRRQKDLELGVIRKTREAFLNSPVVKRVQAVIDQAEQIAKYSNSVIAIKDAKRQIQNKLAEFGWIDSPLTPIDLAATFPLTAKTAKPVVERYNRMVAAYNAGVAAAEKTAAPAIESLKKQIAAIDEQKTKIDEAYKTFVESLDTAKNKDVLKAAAKKGRVLEVKASVAEQRAVLQQAVTSARIKAASEIADTRYAIYMPVIESVEKRLAQAKTDLTELAFQYDPGKMLSAGQNTQIGMPADIVAEISRLSSELEKHQASLELVNQKYMAGVDSADIIARTNEDALVQFERKVLAAKEEELKKAIDAANIPSAELQKISNEAAAQRLRAAKAEAAQRAEQEKRDEAKQKVERQLAARFKGIDTKRTLYANAPTDDVKKIKSQLREELKNLQEILKSPTTKKTKYFVQRYKNQIAQIKTDLARIDIDNAAYLTKEENSERVRLKKILDATDVEERTMAAGRRAVGPVVKDVSAEPTKLRTGTAESKAGLTSVPVSQRITQAKAPKYVPKPTWNIAKAEEEASANRLAELMSEDAVASKIAEEEKKKTKAQKQKEAEQAVKDAEELQKQLDKKLIAQRKGDEFFSQFIDDTDSKYFLREMSDAYDAPQITPLKIAVIKALDAGSAKQAAALLSENGSTPFVRKLAGVLADLVGDVKTVLVDELIVNEKPAAGAYVASTATARFHRGMLTEETVMHELIHAATINALSRPVEQLNRMQQAARAELESMFAFIKDSKVLSREYAKTDINEFAAELLSNRVLQDKLAGIKWVDNSNWLKRFYNKVLEFFGVEPKYFRDVATKQVLNLFEKAVPMTDSKQLINMASVMRGVFPNTASTYAPNVPANVLQAANAGVARNKTFVEKVHAFFFSPSAPLAWRTQLLDRFAPIEALLKSGVARKVIDSMQAFQTLYYLRFGEQRSQFVSQAASYGPVRRVKHADGTFTIESEEGVNLKQIAESLREAGKAGIGNEQAAEAMFTTWLRGIRASNKKVGWDKLNYADPAKAKANWETVDAYIKSVPEIEKAFSKARDQYREYNGHLLDFLVESGALGKQKAAELKSMDYIPYYRIDNDRMELMIDSETRIRIGDIKNQPYLKELIGGEDATLDFFDAALQNTHMLMDMALRNIQTKDVAYVLQKLGASFIRPGSGPATPNVVRFYEDGEIKHAIIGKWEKDPQTGKFQMKDDIVDGVPADLLVKGMEGIKTTVPALVRYMQYPANLLRKTVTIMPSYALRQAFRDPLNAWLVTGGNFAPIASSFRELGKMVTSKSELETTLQKAGAISSNVFSHDRDDMKRILREVASGKTGFNKWIARAEGFAIQGDSSTRAVLYNMYRQKGMSHMQALLGSLESMNFGRRGVSPSMHYMSIMVPFFNAQVQGLDVIWRAATGASVFEEQMQVQQALLRRGFYLAAGTMAYAALMQDDDSYKNATPEQRALNWFVPIPGADTSLRLPIPFELGYAFKAIPEMVYNVALGDQKAKEAAKALGAIAYNTVPIGMPQGMKPIVEIATNYSFFSGAPIEYGRMMGLQKGERYTANTTELAKLLSAATGSTLSPAQVEHLVRGYTSTLGITLMQIPDIALRPLTDQAERPTRLISEYPVIGTLFQPTDGRGVINAAYDRIEEFQQAKSTFNKMLEEGRTADARTFAQKYATEIAATSIGGSFRQSMGELAKLKRAIAGSKEMTPDQKRDKIAQIRQLEIKLSQRIRSID